MSAYIVNKAHIDALLRVAIEGPADRGPSYPGDGWLMSSYYHKQPDGRLTSHEVSRETRDALGAMLIVECATSVRYRYHNEPLADLPGPIDKDFVRLALLGQYTYNIRARHLTAVEALKAIDGYEYQSCEHPDWEASEAYTFCETLRKYLISSLPGYDAADTWEVDELVTAA